MGERRFRLIDGAAGVLWVASFWLLVRGGFGDVGMLHAWGLAIGGVALAATIWAMAVRIADRVVERVSRRMERRLRGIIGGVVIESMREIAFDELARGPHQRT